MKRFNKYLVAVSGPRDITQKDVATIKGVIHEIVDDPDVELVYFGGAVGTDTVALRAAHEYRKNNVPGLIVVVPNKVDHQPHDAQEAIRMCADEVIELGREISKSDGFAAYHRRNEHMIDEACSLSGILVAFNRGKVGGTGNAIEYAESKGYSVVSIPLEDI